MAKMSSYTRENSLLLEEFPLQYRKLTRVPFRTRKFTSRSPYRAFQILQLVIGAFTLFPIRLVLLILTFAIGYITAFIAHKLTPLGGILSYCKFASNSWSVIITNRVVRLTLFSMGLTSIKFKGKVPVDYGNDTPWLNYSVIVAPHSGTFDWSMIVARATRLLSPTIKEDAYKAAAHYIKLTAPIVIDRGSSESRRKAVQDTKTRITEGTSDGWFPVLCFPEGTNGNRKQLLRFKAGPFIAGKPVIPVIIRYPQDDDLDDNDLITWAHFGRSVLFSIFICMCRLQTTIIYQFLDPYFPTSEEQKNALLYAENVRQCMSKEAKLPTSDWTFDDVKLMKRCKKSGLQPEIGAVKIAKIFEATNIKRFDIVAMDLLELFIELLEKHMTLKEREQNSKLLPVLNKQVLVEHILKNLKTSPAFGKSLFPGRGQEAFEKVGDVFRRKLPNYVSFEQLAIVYAEALCEASKFLKN